ncbi:MAG TPA: hypothetical protein VLM37_03845 [Fibrobacteraceae bacterium]|nr:hypothetical protein [Fibrobacteraceae bacterium]
MKVLRIISDSLGLSRPWQGLHSHHTYGALLQNHWGTAVHVQNCGLRANTITQEMNEYAVDHYFDFGVHFYVFQLGLVDCFPRVLFDHEIDQIKALPFGRELLQNLREQRFRLTREHPRQRVPLEEYARWFESICGYLCSQDSTQGIFLVNIAAPAEETSEMAYGQWENVRRYNAVLRDLAEKHSRVHLVDVHEASIRQEGLLLRDGQHLSIAGHRWMAEAIWREAAPLISGPVNTEGLIYQGMLNGDLVAYYFRAISYFSQFEKATRYFTIGQNAKMFAATLLLAPMVYSVYANPESLQKEAAYFLLRQSSKATPEALHRFPSLPLEKIRENLLPVLRDLCPGYELGGDWPLPSECFGK